MYTEEFNGYTYEQVIEKEMLLFTGHVQFLKYQNSILQNNSERNVAHQLSIDELSKSLAIGNLIYRNRASFPSEEIVNEIHKIAMNLYLGLFNIDKCNLSLGILLKDLPHAFLEAKPLYNYLEAVKSLLKIQTEPYLFTTYGRVKIPIFTVCKLIHPYLFLVKRNESKFIKMLSKTSLEEFLRYEIMTGNNGKETYNKLYVLLENLLTIK